MKVQFKEDIICCETYSKTEYDRTPIYITNSQFENNRLFTIIEKLEKYHSLNEIKENGAINMYITMMLSNKKYLKQKLVDINKEL